MYHNRAVPSAEAVSNCVECGEKHADLSCAGPRTIDSMVPDLASHRRAVYSHGAVTMRLPSGENDALVT